MDLYRKRSVQITSLRPLLHENVAVSLYISESALHWGFLSPPLLNVSLHSVHLYPEAATSRREYLSLDLCIHLWNMIDVNDYHWWPPAPFCLWDGAAGDFSSAHLNTCADGHRLEGSSLWTLLEFTIRAASSFLPSWSDRRSSKFLRRQLKVIKKKN